MKVTGFTREALAWRRQENRLRAAGFENIRGPWDLISGRRYRDRITAVEIGADGKSVWVKCTAPELGHPPRLPHLFELAAPVGPGACSKQRLLPDAGTFTNVDFARYATSIASKAAKWARDILDDPADAPPSGSVERFGMEIAGALDALSEASTRKPRT